MHIFTEPESNRQRSRHRKVVLDRYASYYTVILCNLGNKTESNADSLQLWHERLSHQNIRHVSKFLKNWNIEVVDDSNFFCEGCAYEKHHGSSFHEKVKRAIKSREIIYTDIRALMEGEKLYFLTFNDDFSKFAKTFTSYDTSQK